MHSSPQSTVGPVDTADPVGAAPSAVLSVWIVNHNSTRYLRHCLAGLASPLVRRIVILDNASRPDERAQLQQLAAADSRIEILLSERNIGFGAGHNEIGRRTAASATPDEMIWILNPDTVIGGETGDTGSARDSDSNGDIDSACDSGSALDTGSVRDAGSAAGTVAGLCELISAGRADLLSPVILSGRRGEESVWFAGGSVDARSGRVTHRRDLPPAGSTLTSTPTLRECNFLTGTALMTTRATWDRLGGFREELFLYWEDADLSLRAAALGLRLAVAVGLRIWHAEGGTSRTGSGVSALTYYYTARNRILVCSPVSSKASLVAGRGAPALARLAAVALVKGGRGRTGRGWAVVRGTVDGIRGRTGDRRGTTAPRASRSGRGTGTTDPHVLLDATAIPAQRGGVGRYVDNLAAALDERGTRLTVACQERDAAVFAALAPHGRIVAVAKANERRALRMLWEQTRLPWLARRLSVDVIHSPHYTMPLATAIPVVTTLHDATFFTDAAVHTGAKARFFRAWTRLSLRRAAICVVPSQATADELTAHAGAEPDRMLVAHLGVDPARFHPPSTAQIDELRRHLDLPDAPWIAFLGVLEPRKNVPALIEAFVTSCTAGAGSAGSAESAGSADRANGPVLILAGAPGWDPAIAPALAAVPPSVRILTPGHLPADLLAALLGGSEVVCYPSLGEGFGLPVLEAMACGAAVLTTRRLSLPEVGGDAVAYCGTSAPDIAAALDALLSDPVTRQRMADAALERAKLFTWATTAERHQLAYSLATAVPGR